MFGIEQCIEIENRFVVAWNKKKVGIESNSWCIYFLSLLFLVIKSHIIRGHGCTIYEYAQNNWPFFSKGQF